MISPLVPADNTELTCSWLRLARSSSGVTGMGVARPSCSLYNTCGYKTRIRHLQNTSESKGVEHKLLRGYKLLLRVVSGHTGSTAHKANSYCCKEGSEK